MPAHAPGRIKRLLSHARRLLEAIYGEIELHRDARQFLFQRVVQVASDAIALFQNGPMLKPLTNRHHLIAQTSAQYKDPCQNDEQDPKSDSKHPDGVVQTPPGWLLENGEVLCRTQQHAKRLGNRPEAPASHHADSGDSNMAAYRN